MARDTKPEQITKGHAVFPSVIAPSRIPLSLR
jgi:hypothetical protein